MSVIDMFFVITEKMVVDILQSEKELPPSFSSDMGDPREQQRCGRRGALGGIAIGSEPLSHGLSGLCSRWPVPVASELARACAAPLSCWMSASVRSIGGGTERCRSSWVLNSVGFFRTEIFKLKLRPSRFGAIAQGIKLEDTLAEIY